MCEIKYGNALKAFLKKYWKFPDELGILLELLEF